MINLEVATPLLLILAAAVAWLYLAREIDHTEGGDNE